MRALSVCKNFHLAGDGEALSVCKNFHLAGDGEGWRGAGGTASRSMSQQAEAGRGVSLGVGRAAHAARQQTQLVPCQPARRAPAPHALRKVVVGGQQLQAEEALARGVVDACRAGRHVGRWEGQKGVGAGGGVGGRPLAPVAPACGRTPGRTRPSAHRAPRPA